MQKPFGNRGVEPPALHPPDGEKIGDRRKPPVEDRVLAGAARPRTMRDRDLLDAEPFDEQEGGEESVHAFEEFDGADCIRTKNLQRTAGILDLVS